MDLEQLEEKLKESDAHIVVGNEEWSHDLSWNVGKQRWQVKEKNYSEIIKRTTFCSFPSALEDLF